jgi:hypothetical protein
MKTMSERLRKRMRKDRPTVTISLRIPNDVIEDLQEIAPSLGFSNHLALARAYIGQGLRHDLERLEQAPIQRLTENLRKQGLSDDVISMVITESKLGIPDLAASHS